MMSDFFRCLRMTAPPLASLFGAVFPSIVVIVSPLSFSMMPMWSAALSLSNWKRTRSPGPVARTGHELTLGFVELHQGSAPGAFIPAIE
jgi:hypothetical protein